MLENYDESCEALLDWCALGAIVMKPTRRPLSQAIRLDVVTSSPIHHSQCGSRILSPGVQKLALPIALNVTTKQGLQFVAEMDPVRHCEESTLTLTPLFSERRIPVDASGVEASLGVWVFLHTFQDAAWNHTCDAASHEGVSECIVQSTPLRLSYDRNKLAFVASFIAEWSVKFYKISLEVMPATPFSCSGAPVGRWLG